MTAFSWFHAIAVEGRSATRVPTCWISVGYLSLKKTSGPSGQPVPFGIGSNEFGSFAVGGSSTSDTFGTCGLAASAAPPYPSSREKLPTVAKSCWMAPSVCSLLVAPEKPSSRPFTISFRPLMPPCEFT